MRISPIASLAPVCGLLLASLGCSSETGRQGWSLDDGATVVGDSVPAGVYGNRDGEPFILSFSQTFCNEGGEANLLSVEPHAPTPGFQVQDFASVPSRGMMLFGDRKGEIADLPENVQASRTIEACGSGTQSEIIVQVARGTSAPAVTRGFDFTWESDGDLSRYFVPLVLLLCDSNNLDAPRCQQQDYQRDVEDILSAG